MELDLPGEVAQGQEDGQAEGEEAPAEWEARSPALAWAGTVCARAVGRGCPTRQGPPVIA